MDSVLFQRVQDLCNEQGITLRKLEIDLEMGNGAITKWKTRSNPSVESILKVAKYFEVSVDYLIGVSNIKTSAEGILGDEEFISLQRAKQRMSPQDSKRVMDMIRTGFEYAFSDEDDPKNQSGE